MDVFEKWNKNIDTEALKKDEKEAAENSASFKYKEIPEGVYEVTIDKMELKESKKGSPMVSIWFKISAGEFKKSRIFYNQVIDNGIGLHSANDLLRSMKLECVETADANDELFRDYRQYADLLMDAAEEADSMNLSFQLCYTEAKNGFHNFEIEEVFEN